MQFGGRVGLAGYLPGDLAVSVRGEGMQLRYPEGVRSVVDADLSVRGNVQAPTLGGTVTVRSATWSRRVDPTGGLQAYVAVQHGPGEDDVTHQQVPAGGAEKSATFFGLDETANYCFQVVVIVSATDIPATPEVCVVR